jgi:hypothetical protein
MPPTTIDETTRVNLPLRLLWGILGSVALGAVFATGVYLETRGARKDVGKLDAKLEAKINAFEKKFEDHERRLIRIEAKAGIAGAGKQTAEGWGNR